MPVLRRLAALLVVLASGAAVSAQDVPFESSNLPVVILDTGGEAIPDEPKITARMRIVDNGPGERNALADEPTGYDGFVGIEVRGSTSQQFPKKQYGVETRDADGDDLDVSLLGFPEEEDWVLYAPYSDKALMRNVLAYGLARKGWLRERMAWLDRTFSRPVAAEPGAGRGGLALSLPAPNPARHSARLTLTLGEAQDVAVDVVDVRGRVVARLLDGPLAAGAHAVAVDAAALAAGVYLVRVRGAGGQATRRVVVAGR